MRRCRRWLSENALFRRESPRTWRVSRWLNIFEHKDPALSSGDLGIDRGDLPKKFARIGPGTWSLPERSTVPESIISQSTSSLFRALVVDAHSSPVTNGATVTRVLSSPRDKRTSATRQPEEMFLSALALSEHAHRFDSSPLSPELFRFFFSPCPSKEDVEK